MATCFKGLAFLVGLRLQARAWKSFGIIVDKILVRKSRSLLFTDHPAPNTPHRTAPTDQCAMLDMPLLPRGCSTFTAKARSSVLALSLIKNELGRP